LEKKQFLDLLKKHRLGETSEQEEAYLAAYYDLFEGRPDVTEVLDLDETDFLKNQIKDGLKEKITSHQDKPAAKTKKLYYRLIAAAIVIIAFSAALLNYTPKGSGNLFSLFRHPQNDIEPGSNKAILTLANGKKIILNNAANGFLAQQGGTQIINTAGQLIYNAVQPASGVDTAYNTITTPRGGQYVVILPDSSKVYLDAASSLHFPAAFAGKLRTVMLTGEAYFEVAHNKEKPFHVITKGQIVEVLGTHFNINAYDDEKAIKTTLLQGSVRVSAGADIALLTPGEQSQLGGLANNDKSISIVKNANTEEAVAWKNGLFQFENADLKTIMRQFARWYNVDVEYNGAINERLFSGEIHRNLTLQQALELLNYANVNFNISGRKIIITP